MNNQESRSVTHWTTAEITKIALVASLYVALTVLLSVISFGAVQIRLSEMFNYLALYNKRYVWAVTIGVLIANLASPNGLMDVVVGSICTFLVLQFSRWATKNIQSLKLKMVLTAIIFAISMFTVAGQLKILFDAPFFENWWLIAIGELLSMTIGGLIIYFVGERIDLTE
ncbi:putative membrane protein [Enterococcus sp. PF1-24]|uniref:QueT transporter family protein n=1 Tax=unclassified Enterococcus TaxID=2608891 RepID=UPI0024745146|nr:MULTISPECIES: QueT transporter family protein [unclassified Enterococcus]MDH6363251.1 putative membrane protein [Enterococcus sp. PFB1-1]MDH6400448.1 putative membrane protein [Enterococcus sp. PF1-24]